MSADLAVELAGLALLLQFALLGGNGGRDGFGFRWTWGYMLLGFDEGRVWGCNLCFFR